MPFLIIFGNERYVKREKEKERQKKGLKRNCFEKLFSPAVLA